MGARSETLARQFEAKAQEALAAIQGLSETDWRKVTAAERWSVGVTAHHLASVFEPIAAMVGMLAAGERLEPVGREMFDEMNARHAAEFAECTRAETIELHRRGAGAAASTIRALGDEALARSGTLLSGEPPMSVEQLITGGLLAHIDEHLGSIRKTIGH